MIKFTFIIESKSKYIKERTTVIFADSFKAATEKLTPEERERLKGIIEE